MKNLNTKSREINENKSVAETIAEGINNQIFKTYSSELFYAIACRIRTLKAIIDCTDKRLENAPEGNLHVKKTGNYYKYFRYTPTDEQGTPAKSQIYLNQKESKLISALAQKDYDISIKNHAEKELHKLEGLAVSLDFSWPDNVYSQYCDARKKYICPVAVTDDEFALQWMNKPYEPLAFSEDNKNFFYTARGERVRSKSEAIIADALLREGIPYKYECPLQLAGSGRYQRGTVYPDFTVLNKRTRTEFYWEHLGKMDDPNYMAENLTKICRYEQSGIFPGLNLIISHETSSQPLDMRIIPEIIKRYLK